MLKSRLIWMVLSFVMAIVSSSAVIYVLRGKSNRMPAESGRNLAVEKADVQHDISNSAERDAFANTVKCSGKPTVRIQSSVDGGAWREDTAMCPLKGQKIALKVEQVPGADIRWWQIIPDTSRL